MAETLQMYDISMDVLRAPTQKDLDVFQAVVQAYGQLRMVVRQGLLGERTCDDVHQRLLATIAKIEERYVKYEMG